MRKIPSFTIIELIVTLLIASVITGICYYAFFLMNNRFSSFYTRSEEINTWQLFNKALQKDTKDATAITTTENGNLLLTLPGTDRIHYQFTDSLVIRKQLYATDSFKLKIIVDAVSYVNDTIPLISSLRMQVNSQQERIPLVFFKEYTSGELINYYTVSYE